ncbi:unnamed protein product [Rangifer tarandus platyrhynchus]|uniref:Uncharacterized protein n=2 Tax=Rangifer tarandus platyrhynchus TaxID=3082113 RepID=A0ACB0FE57_RANTA|nr:unnamed protein product [Rangifer tarandus platyrhynchus]CAI9711206.1 unnamed protein product [Rangifer tarandus platyrhynchus]
MCCPTARGGDGSARPDLLQPGFYTPPVAAARGGADSLGGVRTVLPDGPGWGRCSATALWPGFCTPPTKATRHSALRAICSGRTRPPKRLQRE